MVTWTANIANITMNNRMIETKVCGRERETIGQIDVLCKYSSTKFYDG